MAMHHNKSVQYRMAYKSMMDCVKDLERHGQLLRIKTEVDPDQEMAEIHRRIFDAGGPAILFEKVKGSPFKAVSNIYGTFERTEFIFRHTIEKVRKVIELKADPANLAKNPFRYLSDLHGPLGPPPPKTLFDAHYLWNDHSGTTAPGQVLAHGWRRICHPAPSIDHAAGLSKHDAVEHRHVPHSAIGQ